MLLVQQTGPRPTAPALSLGSIPGARIRPFRPFVLLKKNEIERNWRRVGVLRTRRAAWAVRAVDEDAQESLDETQALAARVARLLLGSDIFLVGMMGSGKSAVGRQLAAALQYDFVDSDAKIESVYQKPIREIFKRDGEAAFRDQESYILKQLAQFRNQVVSTGGGAILRSVNWEFMRTGVVVWLEGAPELFARRVVADDLSNRPLLSRGSAAKQKDPEEQYREALADISRLLDRRRPLYEMADVAVPLEAAGTGPEKGLGAPIAEVVHRLLLALELRLTQDQNLIFREPASEDFPEAPAPIAAEE